MIKLRATPLSVAVKEFWKARGTLIGSPTLNNIVFPTIAQFLTYLRGLRPKNRLVGAFGSLGWGGGAVKEMYEATKQMGLETVRAGHRRALQADLRGRAEVLRVRVRICGEGQGVPREDSNRDEETRRMIMSKSEQDLKDAFAGESQANRKYLAFAKKADQEGFKQVAKLFRAAAEAETVHAHNHLRAMGGIKSTRENLDEAVNGEVYEFQKMYPAMIEDAKSEGQQGGGADLHLRERGGEDPRGPLQEGHRRPGEEQGDGLLRLPGMRQYGRRLGSRQVPHLRCPEDALSRRWNSLPSLKGWKRAASNGQACGERSESLRGSSAGLCLWRGDASPPSPGAPFRPSSFCGNVFSSAITSSELRDRPHL